MAKDYPMTDAQEELGFTKADALAIQEKHLKEWERVLQPWAFEQLKEEAMKDNDEIENPFCIPRGNSLDDILHRMRIGD